MSVENLSSGLNELRLSDMKQTGQFPICGSPYISKMCTRALQK